MSAGAGFDDLVREGARSFLQTVLVIDNELEMTRPPRDPAPRLVLPPTAPFSRPRSSSEPSAPAGTEGLRSPAEERGKPDATVAGPEPIAPPVDASPLDVKSIMDAFLRNSLICGMHRPERRDDLVGEAIRAACRADAVIIDWLLVGSDSTPAKNIIAGILEGDREDHGRLRLIVVYTSEPRIEGIAREIIERLAETALSDKGGGVLVGQDTRIVVLNKARTVTAAETVSIDDLPERIVREFAKLSDGVLGTFAVTAVAAVRRATHHVLAIFSSGLDGAFLAHRCALKTPDDATEFALELLAGEFKGVVSRSGEATRILSAAPLQEWIARRATDDGMITSDEVRIPVDVVKGFASDGEGAVVASGKGAVQELITAPGQPKAKGGPGKKAIKPRTVGRLFHDSPDLYREAHHGFARLAQFKAEPYGRRAPHGDWRPTLSLGSLIVALDARNVPVPNGYLLCTQPRCDAVRIGQRRRFPFQSGQEVSHDAFNVVAAQPTPGSVEPVAVLLSIDMKPFDTVMIEFPATADDRVLAAADGKSFVFTDTDGNAYLWLGDLRDLSAQRTAGKVAARLHDVGIDEFEWLRLHASEKPPKGAEN